MIKNKENSPEMIKSIQNGERMVCHENVGESPLKSDADSKRGVL